MQIGKKIKELREARKMSLTELANLSGVQLATLSRIENLKMVGTVESHINIAKALGVDITHLYKGIHIREESTPSEPSSTPTTRDTFSHNDQAYFEILTKNVLGKKMMPVLLKIDPHGKTNVEQSQPGAEKFLYVLKGEIEVKLEEQSFPLKKNSTFYFDASQEHFFVNPGKSPAKVICVGTPVML